MLSSLRTAYRLRRAAFLSRLRRRLCGVQARAVLAKTSEGLFACDPEDMAVGWHVCQSGAWDAPQIDILRGLITPQSRVLVAGTHIGMLTIPLARSAREVVAFEANPATFELLDINLRLNNITNCTAHNVALGSTAGTARFLQNRVNSGGSKIRPKNIINAYVHDQPDEVEVPVVAVDEFMEDASFDLIVMDIEGSEHAALCGMKRALETCKHLQVEYLPHHLDNVAGVTDDQFAALLASHFRTVWLQGTERRSTCDKLAAFLKELRADDLGGDLLLAK